MLKLLKNLFKKPIYIEVAEAYWHKLPEEIEVKWFRDGEYIIGKITADGHDFMTQGKDARDFIDMVNDAVFSVYEIPKQYFDVLNAKRFYPKQEALMKLNDNKISFGEINLEKELVKVS
ncbi:MAG: hypothetical protein NTX00_05825 [Candidatus Parcubacteria bacterium]|nr:hypothetical protein [Candidatus Parcubacteria bacterium]